ncbi:hypothetical protein EIP86_010228, partial [Pleurotus ostreatoroseus]
MESNLPMAQNESRPTPLAPRESALATFMRDLSPQADSTRTLRNPTRWTAVSRDVRLRSDFRGSTVDSYHVHLRTVDAIVALSICALRLLPDFEHQLGVVIATSEDRSIAALRRALERISTNSEEELEALTRCRTRLEDLAGRLEHATESIDVSDVSDTESMPSLESVEDSEESESDVVSEEAQ